MTGLTPSVNSAYLPPASSTAPPVANNLGADVSALSSVPPSGTGASSGNLFTNSYKTQKAAQAESGEPMAGFDPQLEQTLEEIKKSFKDTLSSIFNSITAYESGATARTTRSSGEGTDVLSAASGEIPSMLDPNITASEFAHLLENYLKNQAIKDSESLFAQLSSSLLMTGGQLDGMPENDLKALISKLDGALGVIHNVLASGTNGIPADALGRLKQLVALRENLTASSHSSPHEALTSTMEAMSQILGTEETNDSPQAGWGHNIPGNLDNDETRFILTRNDSDVITGSAAVNASSIALGGLKAASDFVGQFAPADTTSGADTTLVTHSGTAGRLTVMA